MIRQKACKNCTRLEVKKHYIKNRAYYLTKARKRNLSIQRKAIEYIGKYLSSHPCVDCGEKDIIVLEFDHIESKDKDDNVSHIIRNTGSLQKLIEEISKCEVRCANCHRRKTAKYLKNWKIVYNIEANLSTHSSTG